MAKLHDLIIGQRFGRLTVQARAETLNNGSARWLCRCDCGQEKIIRGSHLISKRTQSCGCLYRETRERRPPISFKFLASLTKPEDGPLTTPCWIVHGRSRSPDGYIRLWHKGKSVRAHRAMYELLFGPISNGLVVRHHCDRPACINPCHLDVGTIAHNNADMVARGRQRTPRGELNSNAKLTNQDVLVVRALLKTGNISQQKIAELFGVAQTLISQISRRKIWKEIPG